MIIIKRNGLVVRALGQKANRHGSIPAQSFSVFWLNYRIAKKEIGKCPSWLKAQKEQNRLNIQKENSCEYSHQLYTADE